ncbi:MAG: lipopolysaccharide kinase InaA family protein [Planctomycetota bacterium]|jgi:hypothetical protein
MAQTLIRSGPVSRTYRVTDPMTGATHYEKRYRVLWPWLPLRGLLKVNMPCLRAAREVANADALRALDIPVPRAELKRSRVQVAARWLGLVHRSTLTIEAAAGVPLDKLLGAGLASSKRRDLCGLVGRLARRMHQGSRYHRDLYLCHLFYDVASDRLSLIDVARADRRRLFVRRYAVKDLAALLYSARGLGSRADALRVLYAYLGLDREGAKGREIRIAARRAARVAVRGWIHTVRGRALRLAAHGRKG